MSEIDALVDSLNEFVAITNFWVGRCSKEARRIVRQWEEGFTVEDAVADTAMCGVRSMYASMSYLGWWVDTLAYLADPPVTTRTLTSETFFVVLAPGAYALYLTTNLIDYFGDIIDASNVELVPGDTANSFKLQATVTSDRHGSTYFGIVGVWPQGSGPDPDPLEEIAVRLVVP